MAIAAFGLLIACATWSDQTAAAIGQPTYSPTGALAWHPVAGVAAPDLGPFERYDVNGDNPFVPWRERDRPDARAPGRAPPRPEPEVPKPPVPTLDLPTAQPGGGDAPRARGFARIGGRDTGLIVRLPGEAGDRQLAPGGRAGRWTLLAIEDGNIAVFADETGRQYRLVIGGR